MCSEVRLYMNMQKAGWLKSVILVRRRGRKRGKRGEEDPISWGDKSKQRAGLTEITVRPGTRYKTEQLNHGPKTSYDFCDRPTPSEEAVQRLVGCEGGSQEQPPTWRQRSK